MQVKCHVSMLFFSSVIRPFQDYFNSYETGQSVGEAKTGEPREKTPGTSASRTLLVSHVAKAGLEPLRSRNFMGITGCFMVQKIIIEKSLGRALCRRVHIHVLIVQIGILQLRLVPLKTNLKAQDI